MEIDNKKVLEDLEKKYEELEGQYKEVETEWIAEFEGTQEYNGEYKDYDDEMKEIMHPEWFKKEQEKNDLKRKKGLVREEILKVANKVKAEYEEAIEQAENKIKVNEKFLEKTNIEIETLQKEIDEIEQSEEYKNGDEEKRLELEDKKAILVSKTYRRDTIAKDIPSMREGLEAIKKEKEQLLEKYGEEIEAYEKASKETPEEKDKNEDDAKDNKENKSKGKNTRASNGSVVLGNTAETPEELTPEEKAEKEKAEKEKKLKEDFADLSSKAKKGKLTDKELDSFIEILKDKDNYDKLGLSMGLIFNKPRGIFKALNKQYKDDETKLANINEAYSVYEEKFFEKHGKDKLEKLSKFFVIDEIEHRDATKALPEKVETEAQKKSLGDELGDKTVADNEYVDISSSSKTKEEPAKEDI